MSCNPNSLAAAAKGFQAMPSQQLEWVKVYLLCQLLTSGGNMASCDPDDLARAASCFQCFSDRQLQEIQTELICELVQAGGTGGGSCLLCRTHDPVDPPICDCGIFYRPDNGAAWFWDDINDQWCLFVAPKP